MNKADETPIIPPTPAEPLERRGFGVRDMDEPMENKQTDKIHRPVLWPIDYQSVLDLIRNAEPKA